MCHAGLLQDAGAGCDIITDLFVRPLVTAPPVIARPTLGIRVPIRVRVLVLRNHDVTPTNDDLSSLSAFKSFFAWQPHEQLKTGFLAAIRAIWFEHK